MSALRSAPTHYAPPTLNSEPPPPRPPMRPHQSHRGRLLAAAATAVIVVGAASVLPGTPGHDLWVSVANGAALPALPVAAAAPQVDPQRAAIQAVIQKANSEQAQALASSNPSLMSDTATAAHYQQLAQINQNLAAQGVNNIQLTNLTWGPITIDGTTATATSYETWVTTFSDSTTLQSTDTNVYTLVQQNGGWTVQDDQQPPAATAATPPGGMVPGQPAAPAAVAPVAPVSPSAQGTSHNWSGYDATSGSYTGVSGTWTVPQLAPNGASGVGATWVGIGGVGSRDLIQAGTQDVASGTGQSQFQAWIEMLPAASQQAPLAVSPGDSVTVSINEQDAGSGAWLIAFKNNSSGQTYQTTVHYDSSRSSAEWIEEAPSGPNGVVPLDDFGSVAFSSATAIQNGQTVDLSQAGAQPITMLNGNSQPLAMPSGIGPDGSSFSVARTSASATPPASAGRRPSTH